MRARREYGAAGLCAGASAANPSSLCAAAGKRGTLCCAIVFVRVSFRASFLGGMCVVPCPLAVALPYLISIT